LKEKSAVDKMEGKREMPSGMRDLRPSGEGGGPSCGGRPGKSHQRPGFIYAGKGRIQENKD